MPTQFEIGTLVANHTAPGTRHEPQTLERGATHEGVQNELQQYQHQYQ